MGSRGLEVRRDISPRYLEGSLMHPTGRKRSEMQQNVKYTELGMPELVQESQERFV